MAAQVTLAAQGGKLQDPVPAHRGAILLLPDGGQLLNSSPRPLLFFAWGDLKREGGYG